MEAGGAKCIMKLVPKANDAWTVVLAIETHLRVGGILEVNATCAGSEPDMVVVAEDLQIADARCSQERAAVSEVSDGPGRRWYPGSVVGYPTVPSSQPLT
jgi:hypothetical protein